ncbi:hypothetical protein [Kocuria massiliensis]|uniref:hypothetical protein n=1 Tax=Kocuria massiliensis TaxID=1926282 RepID=UPI0022B968E3|nr:hypothetical protein [Kocuria massiliensis]
MSEDPNAVADRYAKRAEMAKSLGFDPAPFRDAEKLMREIAVMRAAREDPDLNARYIAYLAAQGDSESAVEPEDDGFVTPQRYLTPAVINTNECAD